MTEESPRQHLYDLIEAFSNAMLVSRGNGNAMHARPLAVAKIENGGEIFFATGIDTPKVAEIEADPEVLVTFQGTSTFATVRGRARVLRDKALTDELWSESWRVWFPGGKDDPTLCLLAVMPQDGELWDASGMNGIRYAFDAAKAYLTGTRPGRDDDPQQHTKVKL